jgi:tRNA-2-methylthio-N6-dimethylallyladenosine synthase
MRACSSCSSFCGSSRSPSTAPRSARPCPSSITGKGRNPGQAHGRSPWLQAVHFELPHDQAMTIADLVGTIVDVRVIDASLNSLSGELVKVREAAL